MRAANKAKIFIHPRVPLQDVIPLETPFSIEFDICRLCNLKCKFCFHATGEMDKTHFDPKVMDMDLFRKLVDDIKEFPQKPKKIAFLGFGETLIHPKFPEMVRDVKQLSDRIELTTNAVLLTHELSDALIDAGLTDIRISLNGLSGETYFETTGKRVNFANLVDQIGYLYTQRNAKNSPMNIYVKIADISLDTEQAKKYFYDTFEHICDNIFTEHIVAAWNGVEYDGISPECQTGIFFQAVNNAKKVCTFIFTRMLVASDGKIIACCADWRGDLIMGDASKNSLYNIWNGEKFRNLQIRHLRGGRKDIPLCEHCRVFIDATVDDVDTYAAELLAKIERES
jgi:sulfatase maturation enzyme AslB (radical SAM superfamily)